MSKHILTTNQFTDRGLMEELFSEADNFRKQDEAKPRIIQKSLHNQMIASVFYEPSTRTRFSFEAAGQKLGGTLLTSESAGQFSSAIKGETIEDSIRVIAGYADYIIMRHTEEGAAARAATVSPVPIINAGDGKGEHPTQSLLDLYTIKRELGTIDGLKIALVGDLHFGRTVHSLAQLLQITKNPEIFLVAPDLLRLPVKYKDFLDSKGIKYTEHNSMVDVLPQADVVYMTRVQKERFAEMPGQYEKVKDSFVIGLTEMEKMRQNAVLLHPLPRVNEISPEVDADPRAAYFRQAKNGLYVRMSLLNRLALDGTADGQKD